jgi:hypothetical protein
MDKKVGNVQQRSLSSGKKTRGDITYLGVGGDGLVAGDHVAHQHIRAQLDFLYIEQSACKSKLFNSEKDVRTKSKAGG